VSEENVETVRRLSALTAAGDLDAAAALLAPDVEWVVAREHPESRTLVGHQAVGAYWDEWQTTLPDMRIELDRVLDGGGDVVAIGNVRGTGIGSGARVRVPIAVLYSFRDGLICRAEEFLDHSEALKAARLEE
jgi:ketosteroid isomerase-like protein